MVENDFYFKENVKISFRKAKEHNLKIENDVKELKLVLNSKLNNLNSINSTLEDIKALIIRNKIEINDFNFSTGNKGVLNNDKQQPTMINNNQQHTTMLNNDKQQPTTHSPPHKIKHEFLDEFSEDLKEKFSPFSPNPSNDQHTLPEKEEENLTSGNIPLKNEENLLKQTLTPKKLTKDLNMTNKQSISLGKTLLSTLTSNQVNENLNKNEGISQIEPENILDRTLTSNNFNQTTPINPTFNTQSSENPSQTLTSMITGLKEELTRTLTSLTDREISLLLAIHDLNSENLDTSYSHIAQKLKLSENTIRVIVMSLLNKKAPIIKERFFNRKVSLSLKQEFQDLKLLHKLLALRNSTKDQKTLFDI